MHLSSPSAVTLLCTEYLPKIGFAANWKIKVFAPRKVVGKRADFANSPVVRCFSVKGRIR